MNLQRVGAEVTPLERPDQLDEFPRVLAELFRLHFDDLYRFCLLRTGSPTRAEDAAAETFADAARLFASRRGGEVNAGWLFTVARRRVIDQWRSSERERRRLERSLADPTTAGSEPGAEISLTDDEAIVAALDALPEGQRAVLVLRYVDGYSVGEVSDALQLSYRATESMLGRARRSFRRAYEKEST